MNKTENIAVTYDFTAARQAVKSAAASFRGLRKSEDSTTVKCAEAVRIAVRDSYLVSGNDVKADVRKAAGQVTNVEFAKTFGLTNGSLVTYWRRLAAAREAGVTVDSKLWDCLTSHSGGGSAGARAKNVAKVLDDGGAVADITAAMVAEGWDIAKGVKGAKPGTASPGADDKSRQGDGADAPSGSDETPVSPYDAAVAALKVLRQAEKSPTMGPEEWDRIGGIMLGMVAGGDKRRGITREGITTPKSAVKAA